MYSRYLSSSLRIILVRRSRSSLPFTPLMFNIDSISEIEIGAGPLNPGRLDRESMKNRSNIHFCTQSSSGTPSSSGTSHPSSFIWRRNGRSSPSSRWNSRNSVSFFDHPLRFHGRISLGSEQHYESHVQRPGSRRRVQEHSRLCIRSVRRDQHRVPHNYPRTQR